MSVTEEIEKKGINIEELNAVERQEYFSMLKAVQDSQLSIEKLREHIHIMRDGVENELTHTNLDDKQDLFLKARLKNYMLLEAFLISPEKAKKQLENAIENFVSEKLDNE